MNVVDAIVTNSSSRWGTVEKSVAFKGRGETYNNIIDTKGQAANCFLIVVFIRERKLLCKYNVNIVLSDSNETQYILF